MTVKERNYSYRDKEWLFNQYIELGKSMEEITKICNVNPCAIYRWLKKFNITKEIPIYRNKDWLFNQYIKLEKTMKEIGKMCNVDSSTILSWLKRFNIKRETPIYKNKKWLKHQYNKLEKSTMEIGKICNVSTPTILNWLKKFDIPRRSLSESTKLQYQKYPEKIEERSGDKNPNWKNGISKYQTVHTNIRNHKIKTNVCDICKKPENYDKKYGKLELSNMTGKLIDDVDNFQWVHHKCHVDYDKKNNIVHEGLDNKKKKRDKK